MPLKRKGDSPAPRAGKSGRVSRASTPGASARQSANGDDQDEMNEGPDELSKLIARRARKFDIHDFPYTLAPGIKDTASTYFEPAQERDFTALALKPGHENLPLWIDGWGRIVFEHFHWQARRVQDFLITVAEPASRPTFLHEYSLTIHSLYAAVSVGLTTKDIVDTLERFSKNGLPPNIADFITECGKSCGKVKLVLRNTRYFLETTDRALLQRLLRDKEISVCRVQGAESTRTSAPTMAGLAIAGSKEAAGLREVEGLDQQPSRFEQPENDVTAKDLRSILHDDEDDGDITHAFEIQDDRVSKVAQRCLALGYPALEEYDFRNDTLNPDLDIDLRPATQIRPYQERSLSKMFGNGRAKSGIIVLPCGAGKTLVGITAACTIKKGVVVLATGSMSAIQWRNEFIKWTNINLSSISIFSSDQKFPFTGSTGVIVTTYSMVTNTRNRAQDSAKMMDFLASREWGLMLLDEVHVVPAQMFRKVIGCIKAHSKLGLTATLLREDDKIDDLNYLIGPKLYEANWMELSQQGHIARVQCAEVWCPMPTELYNQYMAADPRDRPLFCAMNPTKFQACQYLIKYHEDRGDKIIVFSDNVYALEVYAKKLMKPFLYGGTSISERQQILDCFRNSPACSTLFLSKIGDTSLDLPEATVLIQVSSQYGSRRQEAQHLGRVLRAKRRSEDGFNAFFYSLVSKDTVEMVYSAKRQVFLVDQGYAFRVITQLKNIDKTPGLAFTTSEARHELLQKVLAESGSAAWREEEEKEAAGLRADGNMFYSRGGKPARKGAPEAGGQTTGALGVIPGGQGPLPSAPIHVEQNNGVSKLLKGKPKPAQSGFFQAIAREKERRRQGLARPKPPAKTEDGAAASKKWRIRQNIQHRGFAGRHRPNYWSGRR